MRLGEFDPSQGNRYRNLENYGRNQLTHFDVALDAARQALVLLKNTPVPLQQPQLHEADATAATEPERLAVPQQADATSTTGAVLPLSVSSNLTLALIGTQLGHNEAIKGNYAGNSQPSPNLLEAIS